MKFHILSIVITIIRYNLMVIIWIRKNISNDPNRNDGIIITFIRKYHYRQRLILIFFCNTGFTQSLYKTALNHYLFYFITMKWFVAVDFKIIGMVTMFVSWFCFNSYSHLAFTDSKYVNSIHFLVFLQILVPWTLVNLCEIKRCKMLYQLKCVACLCLSTLFFETSNVVSNPVIIPDVTIIKPRLPENICFNEALDEGGKWTMIDLDISI